MNNQRITKAFAKAKAENRGAFVAYLTMGAPTLEKSFAAAETVLAEGADILELGIPFSDPVADGPVIRKAAAQALANGVTLADVLEALPAFRAKHPDQPLPEIQLTRGKNAFWMQRCTAGLAASGTVTVECAISRLPLVVAYRLNPLTFLFARLIIGKLFRGFFTMVNIILYRCAFEEFLQHQVVPQDLADAVDRILPGGERRAQVDKDMDEMVSMISGGASGAIAKAVSCILKVQAENQQQ